MDKTTQLSNEEKAKIFALYLGCEVIGQYDGERKGYLTGIHGEDQAEIQFFEQDGINVFEQPEYNQYDECKLRLIPLKEITCEDAVEIAKIAAQRPDDYTADNADVRLLRNAIQVVFTDKIDEIINITFDGDVLVYIHPIDGREKIERRPKGQAQYIDKFRELGYALPYKNKDLFELGIAINKTTITN